MQFLHEFISPEGGLAGLFVASFVAATIDLDHCDERRSSWGFFRDRRADLAPR